ncbi:MAG TPA: hypothetical protein VFR29_01365 [Steroidobacteraceae bacterium]|nr:hypothetical protein [Steroidobacteraceae bacterium]
MEPRRDIPEPTYHWPGGPTAEDDPTPLESALAALKFGAIAAAAATILYYYLAVYRGIVTGRLAMTSTVLAAFVLPSLLAFLRTRWVRRRRAGRRPGDADP